MPQTPFLDLLPRRAFLMSLAAALGEADLFAQAGDPRVAAPAGGDAHDGRTPAALHEDDGELVYVGRTRDPVRIKVSPPAFGGRFAMITQAVAPGSVIPVHLHEREDEIIFIQAGEGMGMVADQHVPLRAGSMLYVPQGTWHGGENTSGAALKWVAIYSPSGFEGYFRAIGTKRPEDVPPRRTAAAMGELDRRFGIRYRR